MSALVLAFAAGALTTINPCVLPLLPIFVGSAYASGRLGPLALAAGLVTSFTIVGVAISLTGSFLGLDAYTLRYVAAVLFVAAGAVLLIPALDRRVALAAAPLGNASASLAERAGGHGLTGQFGLGLLAGAIWTPCSGPSLAAAFALAADAGSVTAAAIRLFTFGLGAATVIALIAVGLRTATDRSRQPLAIFSRYAKPFAGALFVAAGVAIFTGADKWLEARLLDVAPDWYVWLTTSV